MLHNIRNVTKITLLLFLVFLRLMNSPIKKCDLIVAFTFSGTLVRSMILQVTLTLIQFFLLICTE